MGFQQAIAVCFSKYAEFGGRARRSEYWWFFVFNLLMQGATAILDVAIFGGASGGVLNGLYSLGVLLPGLGVGVRRLHDTNHSGWWLLISLVPLVGFILLIIWLTRPGDAGPNRFGADPMTTGP